MASSNWPISGGSSAWKDPVASFATLPAIGLTTGEVRLTLDTKNLYEWNGAAWVLILNSSGTVIGPASATDNALARFDATTGKIIQNGVATEDDAGNITATSFVGPLTGNVTGNCSGSAASFTGNLVGDVTGTQGATVVSTIATSTAANVHAAELLANAATNLNTVSTIVKRDGSGNFAAGTITASLTGAASLNVLKNGDTMTGLLVLSADPSAALGAATKQYVDSVAAGLDVKPSVICATTANITLSGEQTLDGILTSASRVLVKNQTAPAENGIYVSGAGAWTRATDMDAWTEVPGAFCFVETGTLYADTAFVCTADAGGTIGTTAITWSQFAGAGTYTTDAQGITLTGTQFSLTLNGTTLSKSASGLKVADLGIADAQIAAAAAITRSKTATGTNYRILANTSAGVMSENAAITGSRAVASDANGQLVAATTTATELGYVNGVTSAIQTQLNAINSGKGIVAISSNVTLTDQRIHLVDTTSARSLTLPSPAATSFIVIKDKTGTASTNNITVVRAASEKIETVAASYTLDADLGSWTFVSDGTDWFCI